MPTPSPRLPSSSSRGKYDDMVIRMGLKDQMRSLIEGGSTFQDACGEVGVPFELALALTKTDEDYRVMWSDSNRSEQGAHSEGAVTRLYPSTVHRSPTEVKEHFMGMLQDAGLYEKLGQMAALAEPGTKEGDRVLMFFGRSILPMIIPKDAPEAPTIIALKEKSDIELKDMLDNMQKKRITDGSE
ncbi:MAG TPA: hypothetical protein EYO59_06625 [Chromatiaceae bacterium]|nr:hypothetical protein [Chromatiaceae bacterium]